jgi:hypothetical protein
MLPKRCKQAASPKIIIAGLAKEIRAFFDECGILLPGKSTAVMTEIKSCPKKLTEYLNSETASLLYRMLYDALSLRGGYMRFGPPQLKLLPSGPSRPVGANWWAALVRACCG